MELLNVSTAMVVGTGRGSLLAVTFVALFVLVAAYAAAVPQGDWRWWVLLAGITALTAGGVLAPEGLLRVALLDAAAFLAVALVWTRGTAEATRAARTYLALLVPAVICLAAGLVLISGSAQPPHPLDGLIVGLFVVGFGLKLALAPFYFWLPAVAEKAAPMTTAVIVAVVDIAAFNELLQLRVVSPWLFDQYRVIWLAVAVLSMFSGALLALAQSDLKRMLAFSTVDDMGYLLLGAAVGSQIGLDGALLGAVSHGLFKALLFGAVGVAEGQLGQPATLKTRGLAALFPISGAAFVVGALGMVGVPPLFGFVGRWRLYLAATQYGGAPLLLIMALATAISLLYYARAIHRTWLGAPSAAVEIATLREAPLAASVLVALVAIVLVLGLFPLSLTALLP